MSFVGHGKVLRSPPESGLSCTILRWIGVSLSAKFWLESWQKSWEVGGRWEMGECKSQEAWSAGRHLW